MTASPPTVIPLPHDQTLVARHYRGGHAVRVRWDQSGLLTAIEPAAQATTPEVWVAPGLLDLQMNGYAGVDFQSDQSLSESALLTVVRSLRRDGCNRIFLTLITSKWSLLLGRIRRYRSIIDKNAELRRSIVGWHVEGPFLSGQPGYSGAHNPAWMQDPTPTHIRELREETGTDPVLLTLAPERMGSSEAIAAAVECGIVVSLGHTNANPAQTREAVVSGATAFTHLGNGCPQQLDRHENILWTILNEPALVAGIIPDATHVSPALFRILHNVLAPERVYWTTDAMSAAGAPPGRYTLGEMELDVGVDQVVRNPLTNTFAGSALTPIEGIRRGAEMLNRPWQDVWDFFSVAPARLMGLSSDLEPNSPGGFCLLTTE